MKITISPAAAERIRQAAAESGPDAPALRLAVRRLADGSLDYGMGFDASRSGDATIEVEGIEILVAPPSQVLIEGTHIDFIELEPGDFRFIFTAAGTPADP